MAFTPIRLHRPLNGMFGVPPTFAHELLLIQVLGLSIYLGVFKTIKSQRSVVVDRRVKAVIDYMSEDLSRPLRLNEVAHSVNLSASRLQHLFKADTNMTAAQYLKSLRMQRAKQLIDSTFLNTKEIMQRVGMRNESHFVREFKKIYGLPPGSYKQRLSAPGITGVNSANK